VRLEAVAEQVAATGVSAEGFAGAVADALQRAATYAVGLKSIAAYRYGLDLEAARPTAAEVQAAAGAWLAEAERTGQRRVSDPVLLRALLWAGWTPACRSSCTSATATPTSACTAATRCC
jgi:hypothetical protein